MAAVVPGERNQDATLWVGGLDEKVTESLMHELFVQVGAVSNVHIPKDKVTQMQQGFGFVEFKTEEDADYALRVLNMVKLYGKPLRLNKSASDKREDSVGANLFIGNLDPEVDEKMLYDTFSAFGPIVQTPKVMRDPDSGLSKGFGFVNFATFTASDAAIEALNGQYLANRAISVCYAYKREGAPGERHGTASERMIAMQSATSEKSRSALNQPHQRFADIPSAVPEPQPGAMPPAPPPGAPTMWNPHMAMPLPPQPPPQLFHLMQQQQQMHHQQQQQFFPPPPHHQQPQFQQPPQHLPPFMPPPPGPGAPIHQHGAPPPGVPMMPPPPQ